MQYCFPYDRFIYRLRQLVFHFFLLLEKLSYILIILKAEVCSRFQYVNTEDIACLIPLSTSCEVICDDLHFNLFHGVINRSW